MLGTLGGRECPLQAEGEIGEVGFLFVFLFIFGYVEFSLLRGLFSSCGEWGLLFIALSELLIGVAFLIVEHVFWVHGIQ